MRARVLHDGESIGEADLSVIDEGMNVRGGAFRPTDAYERVRDAIRAGGGALELQVEIDGTPSPEYLVHIVDFAEFPDELSLELLPRANER